MASASHSLSLQAATPPTQIEVIVHGRRLDGSLFERKFTLDSDSPLIELCEQLQVGLVLVDDSFRLVSQHLQASEPMPTYAQLKSNRHLAKTLRLTQLAPQAGTRFELAYGVDTNFVTIQM